MEFLFHDNMEEANWIVANKEVIAKHLAKSIINFVSVYYYATNSRKKLFINKLPYVKIKIVVILDEKSSNYY